jgi:squalene-associated FAD-dependent desaturase
MSTVASVLASPTDVDVVVLGGGFAGLSAAVRLAAAGRRVLVLEQAPRLGGRASSFTDRTTDEPVDNGQHVLFGCYRETYAFLRTIGSDGQAPLQERLTLAMADRDGRLFPLACPSLTPPWHLLAGVLRWRAIGLRDRVSAVRVSRLIRLARREGAEAAVAAVPADQTVAVWLSAMRQSPRLREWLWHPLAIAALNQSPETAAAGPFVRVVVELFGPRPEDATVGLARVPLGELYAEPARRFIERRGGHVQTTSAGTVTIDGDGRAAGVWAGGRTVTARAVVSAVPWHAFGRIWEDSPPVAMRPVAANAAAMQSSPIVTVNLWLDGPVMPAPFVGMVDGPMHWVFDKHVLFGGSAGHLSAVASGAGVFDRLDNRAVTEAAVTQLRRTLPRMRDREVIRAVVVRERRATFSLAPGGPPRPGTTTGVPGFFLAGDWTDTGLPATIEGAVVSGHRAADAVLAARS